MSNSVKEPSVDVPFGLPESKHVHYRLMYDLMALAFAGDIAHHFIDRRLGADAGGVADQRIGGDAAGGEADRGAADRADAAAPGQQQRHHQPGRRRHCNDPHRSVAGSAVAHFQSAPSWQIAAV